MGRKFTLREYLKVIAGTGGVGGRGKSENAGDLEEEECKEDEQNNNEIEVDGRRRKVAKHVHITDSIRKLFFNSSEMIYLNGSLVSWGTTRSKHQIQL